MCKSLELLDSGFAVSSSTSRGVFQGFWRMLFYGSTLLIRLVNVHVAWLEAFHGGLVQVLIGVLSTYGVMEFSLRILMQVFFGELRSSEAR